MLKNAPHACFNLGHEKAKKCNLNNLKDGTTKKLKQNLYMIKHVFTSNVSCTKVSFFLYFKLKINDTYDECIIKKKINSYTFFFFHIQLVIIGLW
jgi:hypothetical protein